MTEYQYELFADYHQFYIQDEEADGNLGDSWTDEACNDMLALADSTIGVGTARNMTVPVTIQVCDAPPDEDFSGWDQVNECSIETLTGRLVVAGCTEYFATAARILVKPGWYRARIFYGDLEKLSENGLEGEDHYKVVLWPAKEAEPQILKRRDA